jgi:ADP-heptose:LPS heptosyltransferase
MYEIENLVRRAGTARDALLAGGSRLLSAALRVGRRGGGRKTMTLADARSVVVVCIDEIGDSVLLGPFLRELSRLAPGASVTLVVQPGVSAWFEHCPYVDEVLVYDPRVPRAARPLLLPLRAWRFARAHLGPRPDLVLVPRWDVDQYYASLLAFYSGGIRRVGYSAAVHPRRRVKNAGFDGFFTDVCERTAGEHEVERSLHLLGCLGADPVPGPLEAWLSDEDRRRAGELLGETGDAPLVALGIGARHPKRRWPLERYEEVARWLIEERQARVVVVGGGEDVPLQQRLTSALGDRVSPLAGRTSLRETAAVLERCSLFVGNDSAPLHLASASGVPIVEISCHPLGCSPAHSNAPERFGPWWVRSIVCRPPVALPPCGDGCGDRDAHCITGVDVQEVREASGYLLAPPDTRAAVRPAGSARRSAAQAPGRLVSPGTGD